MLDTDHKKMINEDKRDLPMNNTDTQKKTYTKARHTTPHSQETKQKIAETQSKRYDMIRQLVRKGQQKTVTEDRVKEIVDEAIERYLRTHATPINNNRPMKNSL